MKPRKKSDLILLKAKIKGLAQEGVRTRKFINRSKGTSKDYYWTLKRSIGEEARYHLIAYGLLRGMLYKTIEPNCRKDKLEYFDYNYVSEICQRYSFYFDRGYWSTDNVKRLINTGTILMSCKVVGA